MQAWELERELSEFQRELEKAQDKLKAIETHLITYPKEKDPKYSGYKDISTQHVVWNMPYFLTGLDVWYKKLVEILKGSEVKQT